MAPIASKFGLVRDSRFTGSVVWDQALMVSLEIPTVKRRTRQMLLQAATGINVLINSTRGTVRGTSCASQEIWQTSSGFILVLGVDDWLKEFYTQRTVLLGDFRGSAPIWRD